MQAVADAKQVKEERQEMQESGPSSVVEPDVVDTTMEGPASNQDGQEQDEPDKPVLPAEPSEQNLENKDMKPTTVQSTINTI